MLAVGDVDSLSPTEREGGKRETTGRLTKRGFRAKIGLLRRPVSSKETAMATTDLERIRFVTRHFTDLQGLRSAALGGLIVVIGLSESMGGALRIVLALVLGAGSLGLLIFAPRYYRRTFGEVERQPSSPRSLLGTFLVFLCFVGVSWLFRSWGEGRNNYIVMGSLLVGRWVWLEGRWSQAHSLVLGLLLLGIAAPGPSSALFLPALVGSGISEILCGAAMSLDGLLDHRQLVRTLGPWGAASGEAEGAVPVEVER
jgi:hypothetical protein